MLKNQYTYRSVDQSDKAMILDWFNKPHVQEFYYGDGLQNTLTNLDLYCQGIKDNGRYRFDHWLALYNKEPFAFLITSPLDGLYDPDDDYNKWHKHNQQTFTLDMLIGPEQYLGQGMAVDMIQQKSVYY